MRDRMKKERGITMNLNEKKYSSKDKKKMGMFLFYSFFIAWGTEIVLIFLYKTGLIMGNLMLLLHFGIIGFGCGLAPAYAAFIVASKYDGITVKTFVGKIFKTPDPSRSAAVLVLFAFIQFCACTLQEKYTGNPWYFFILFIPLMIFGGGLEEIGWQGVFQPLLQKKFPFLIAALIEGVVWSIWHLPLWLVPDTAQSSYDFIAFTLFCITLGVTLAAAHKITESIWVSVLLHAWSNTVQGGMYSLTTLCVFPAWKTLMISLLQISVISGVLYLYEKRHPF